MTTGGQPFGPATAQDHLIGQLGGARNLQAHPLVRGRIDQRTDLRASSQYRHAVLGNLARRFWLESQGQQAINLEGLQTLEALA